MPNIKLLCLAGILLFTLNYAGIVYAHAVVTHDSLRIEAVSANEPSQVKLVFNSRIELGLSQIYLVRSGDKQEKLNIRIGNKPGQIIVNIPSLETGEYALHYKIFAADGHLTDDVIHFTVKP